MKNILLYIIFLVGFSLNAVSQENIKLTVAGSVTDEDGQTLPGVVVRVKENQTQATTTDIDGRFKLSGIKKGSTIIFTMLGCKNIEFKLNANRERERIAMKPDVTDLNEVVVVASGAQRKISVTGAIATIEPAELQIPATSVSNMLGGRIPGIIAVTRSGEPGNDFSEFWIRGISTFGANQSPLVLVDGIEGDLNNLDPSDIESFSVLKDASATAVYGVRGANGIIAVTTKRGKAGKLKFTYKGNFTYSYSPMAPEYVDGYNYANLANEANEVRGQKPLYEELDLELYRTGLDPDLHPNVNWRDVLLKDHTWYQQHYLSISGGGENARYFLSFGYMDKDAVFKTDKSANKYNPNVNWRKYNIRMNIDANLTRTTTLRVGLETAITKQTSPGFGNNSALWTTQANLTPIATPIKYSTGEFAAMGVTADSYNPYVLLNHTGLITSYNNTTYLNMGIRQDLKFITEGLSIDGKFSFTNYSANYRTRKKTPYMVYAYRRDRYGNLYTEPKQNSKDPTFEQSAEINRRYYGEFSATYNRAFGDHRVGGLLLYYMSDYITSKQQIKDETADIDAIPLRYQALSGRFTYSFKDTYFAEFNAGYTGSEAFPGGSQFGFFPAVSAAWVPTQYDFIRDNVKFIDFLKIRGSIGKVGNDRPSGRRFPYLTTIVSGNSGIWNAPEGAVTEGLVGSDNLSWEQATKYNLGLDLHFFKDRFKFTIDFFRDNRDLIFQKRETVPHEVGLSDMPWANVGSMVSKGFDGNLSYGQDIGKDMSFTIRANYTWAKNNIKHWEQPVPKYPYQSWDNTMVGEMRGLVALGLFKDENDIKNSPKQTFGDYMPGDIKYKDINADGVIDSDDVVPLGYSSVPSFQYGVAGEFRYKNWSFGIFFEGISDAKFFYGGSGYVPFINSESGNVLTSVADPKNRWIPKDYAEAHGIDPSLAENQNAKYPRLYYGRSNNNNPVVDNKSIDSTFWIESARYLRLSNIQIGYGFESPFLKKYGLERITLSLIGNNLAVWDNLQYWDAGQASGNGAVYPLQRTFTGQIVINF